MTIATNPYLTEVFSAETGKKDDSVRTDIYEIIRAFFPHGCDPALAHAIKKMMKPGTRNGGKDHLTDLKEALVSLQSVIDHEEAERNLKAVDAVNVKPTTPQATEAPSVPTTPEKKPTWVPKNGEVVNFNLNTRVMLSAVYVDCHAGVHKVLPLDDRQLPYQTTDFWRITKRDHHRECAGLFPDDKIVVTTWAGYSGTNLVPNAMFVQHYGTDGKATHAIVKNNSGEYSIHPLDFIYKKKA